MSRTESKDSRQARSTEVRPGLLAGGLSRYAPVLDEVSGRPLMFPDGQTLTVGDALTVQAVITGRIVLVRFPNLAARALNLTEQAQPAYVPMLQVSGGGLVALGAFNPEALQPQLATFQQELNPPVVKISLDHFLAGLFSSPDTVSYSTHEGLAFQRFYLDPKRQQPICPERTGLTIQAVELRGGDKFVIRVADEEKTLGIRWINGGAIPKSIRGQSHNHLRHGQDAFYSLQLPALRNLIYNFDAIIVDHFAALMTGQTVTEHAVLRPIVKLATAYHILWIDVRIENESVGPALVLKRGAYCHGYLLNFPALGLLGQVEVRADHKIAEALVRIRRETPAKNRATYLSIMGSNGWQPALPENADALLGAVSEAGLVPHRQFSPLIQAIRQTRVVQELARNDDGILL